MPRHDALAMGPKSQYQASPSYYAKLRPGVRFRIWSVASYPEGRPGLQAPHVGLKANVTKISTTRRLEVARYVCKASCGG